MRNWLKIAGTLALTISRMQMKAQSTVYDIKGNMGHLPSSAKAYLMHLNDPDSNHIIQAIFQ